MCLRAKTIASPVSMRLAQCMCSRAACADGIVGCAVADAEGVASDTKPQMAVVSAADAGGPVDGSTQGAAPRAKPRPDALLLSFSEYKPVEHACWVAGQQTPYLHLAQAFQVHPEAVFDF